MPRKYTQQEIEDYFLSRGCKLISDYKNSNTTLWYICTCKNKGKTNLDSFKKGSRCKECAKEKRKQTMRKKFGVYCNLQLPHIIEANIKRIKKYNSCQCQKNGCKKYRQGKTHFCIKHGGGKRCEKNNCNTSTRGTDKYCVKHGGGKRCQHKNCDKSAISGFKYCISHGGGHTCKYSGCADKKTYESGNCGKHSTAEDRKKRALYRKHRRKNDINYKLTVVLRSRFTQALRGNLKDESVLSLLGCNITYYKEYLMKKFTTDMSWNNYGKWQIDHIVPCSIFNMSKKKDRQRCFHYTNTQPMWADENNKKSDNFQYANIIFVDDVNPICDKIVEDTEYIKRCPGKFHETENERMLESSNFHKNRATSDGFATYCKECASKTRYKNKNHLERQQLEYDRTLFKYCPGKTHKCTEDRIISLDDFHNNKAAKDGKSPYCKECIGSRKYGDKRKRRIIVKKIKPTDFDKDLFKWCGTCDKVLERHKFHNNRISKDGLQSCCKECMKEKRK